MPDDNDNQSRDLESRGDTKLSVGSRLAGHAENTFVPVVLLAVAAYAASVWTPLVAAHPLWATGISVAMGLVAGFFRGRRFGRPQARPRYAKVDTYLPRDQAAVPRVESLSAIPQVLGWGDFIEGVEILRRQIDSEDWTPDLVVAVNQGDAMVGMLRGASKLQNARFGVVILDKERRPRSVALPSKKELGANPLRILLIDYQLKTGSAIAAAMALLKQTYGALPDSMRVGALVLSDLAAIPTTRGPHALTGDAFKPVYSSMSEAESRKRVDRLYYLTFVSTSYPRPPWRRHKNP